MLLPHTRPATWPAIAPSRFAHSIRGDKPDGCRAALIGLPDDTGVRLNNGRPGAAFGPTALRAALGRMGTSFEAATRRDIPALLFDAGDFQPAPGSDALALADTHQHLSETAFQCHAQGLISLCIGGGHDLTSPTVRALHRHVGSPAGGISLDAHLDVRESVGSGMPFRALIDGGHVDAKRFAVLGAGAFANSRKHVEWLSSHGSTIVPVEKCRADFSACLARAFETAGPGPMFVTIDLDAIDASQAPGVSAVNPMGLAVEHAVTVARRAGADPRVRHFDIMELSPPHDDPAWDAGLAQPGRTARVAALLVLSFLAGLAERPS